MPEDPNSMLGIAADAPKTANQGDPTKDYLDYLRTHSACKGLRGSIEATFWFNLLLFLLAFVRIGYQIWNIGTANPARSDAEMSVYIMELVGVCFAIMALVVLRQFFLMLVDAADSLILGNMERRSRTSNEKA